MKNQQRIFFVLAIILMMSFMGLLVPAKVLAQELETQGSFEAKARISIELLVSMDKEKYKFADDYAKVEFRTAFEYTNNTIGGMHCSCSIHIDGKLKHSGIGGFTIPQYTYEEGQPIKTYTKDGFYSFNPSNYDVGKHNVTVYLNLGDFEKILWEVCYWERGAEPRIIDRVWFWALIAGIVIFMVIGVMIAILRRR